MPVPVLSGDCEWTHLEFLSLTEVIPSWGIPQAKRQNIRWWFKTEATQSTDVFLDYGRGGKTVQKMLVPSGIHAGRFWSLKCVLSTYEWLHRPAPARRSTHIPDTDWAAPLLRGLMPWRPEDLRLWLFSHSKPWVLEKHGEFRIPCSWWWWWVCLDMEKHTPRDCCFDNKMTMGCWGSWYFCTAPNIKCLPELILYTVYVFICETHWTELLLVGRDYNRWGVQMRGAQGASLPIMMIVQIARWPRRMLKRTECWNHGVMLVCLNIMNQQ